jgi:hypothetical protein
VSPSGVPVKSQELCRPSQTPAYPVGKLGKG